AGNGVISGPVTVNGSLSPGSSLGTLTINNTLTLSGTTVMELDTGASPNSDRVTGLTSVTYGGTLTVNNIGPALAGGEIFTLFSAGSYSGSFGTLNLPSLGTGLNWFTGNLGVDGSLIVNRAPVAGNTNYFRGVGTSLKISSTSLLAVNTSDADGN